MILKLAAFCCSILLFITIVNTEEEDVSSSKEVNKELTISLNKFTSKIILEILQTQYAKNIVISTLPVYIFLTLLAFGTYDNAVVELKAEFREVLHLHNQTEHNILENINEAMASIAKSNFKDELDLFLHSTIVGQSLDEFFQNNLYKYFQISNHVQTPIELEYLNRLVSRGTAHKFKRFLKPEDISEKTFAAFISCLSIEGKFERQFREDHTRQQRFFNNDNTTSLVNMMHWQGLIPYANLPNLKARCVLVRFKNEKYKLVILLPHKRFGLRNLETNLFNLEEFPDFDVLLKRKNVALSIPKFNVGYLLSLADTLQNLGLKMAFSDESFNNIFYEAIDAKLRQIKQLTHFEVDATGVQVVSATLIDLVTTVGNMRNRRSADNANSSKPINMKSRNQQRRSKKPGLKFKANRPFLYLLLKEQNPLLVGHYTHVSLF